MSQDVFKAPKATKRKHGFNHKRNSERDSFKKTRRTKEDFFTFCSIVLEYTQYETIKQEDLRRCNNTSPLDSAGSTAESFTSESTSSSISESEHDEKILDSSIPHMLDFHDESSSPYSVKSELASGDRSDSKDSSFSESPVKEKANIKGDRSDQSSNDESGDEDSWELVTCFCQKPFSGRPMIECSECLTWIHLSCAKIRKSNIPEDFICQKCRESKFTTRKSTRIRSEKKMISA